MIMAWSNSLFAGRGHKCQIAALIFTMEPADFHSLQSEYSDVTKIGVVRSGNGDVLLVDGDTESILAPTGWTHF